MSTPHAGAAGQHLVFSYGTLRQTAVQRALFGGPVPTTPDAALGHTVVPVRVTDPAVVALSGTDLHTGLAASTGPARHTDRVPGAVLSLTEAQLAAADAYESAYTRSRIALASGRWAWAYLPLAAPSGGGPGHGTPRRVDLVLSGLGSVGTALLRLVEDRAADLISRHGLSLAVVAVVDSRGAAVDPSGLDLDAVLAAKARGASVGDLPGVGLAGAGVPEVLVDLEARGARAEMLVEAGPADLVDGGAGLAAVLMARERGMGVVLANKAPLVMAWEQVTGAGPGGGAATVRYSACVGAALPTVDLARSVLVSATATRVEMVLNSTCQRVLGDVEGGLEVGEAITRAQAAGLAEADPSLDVDGTDTAVKLVVLTAALGHPLPLSAVAVTGIRGVTAQQAREAREQGRVLVLLGVAEPAEEAPGGWRLTVSPQALPAEHPLARMDRHETGVVVHTDVAGRIAASGLHHDVTATAAAVLRDVVLVAQQQPGAALPAR